MTEPLGGIAGELGIQPTRLRLPLAPADALELVLAPYPELCASGVLRISVLAMLADIAGGFRAQASLSGSQDSVVTRDLTIRAQPVAAPRTIRAAARTVSAGRNSAVTEVWLLDDSGTRLGQSVLSFTGVRRGPDEPRHPWIEEVDWAPTRLSDDIARWLGVVVIRPECGVVRLDVGPQARNPIGYVQGAVVALLGEVAAGALADTAFGAGHDVVSLEVRYLSGGQVGPVQTSAEFIGDPEMGMIRIVAHDLGRSGEAFALMVASARRRAEHAGPPHHIGVRTAGG